MRKVVVAAGLGLLALCFVPGSSASIDGPCTAVVDGKDISMLSASDPADAISVGPDEVLAYSFSADAPVSSHDAKAILGPYMLQLDESMASGEATSTQGTFDVAQVSDLAVGLYAVEAHAELADGSTCTGEFLLRIEGSALSSTAGMASAAAVVLAGGGVVALSVTTAMGAKSILATLSLVP
jgi:hypothetical protein